MNMNGGTSTSATDPHHRASGGYLGMGGLPGLGNLTPLTPPTGNGFGGAGMSGVGLMPGSPGVVGPELKHHADFLSRLLAATPAYPSDVGNPPPGFFSDWLRRLVSKPPGNGNHHHHHPHQQQQQQQSPHRPARGSPSPRGMSSPPSSTPNSLQQSSNMTFSPPGGQAETNGVSPLESPSAHHSASGNGHGPGNSQGQKRRKRTRISDHHLHVGQHNTTTGHHHSGKDGGSSVRESPSPLASHLNHNQNSLGSSALTSNLSGSSSSSAAAVAAAASLNPFTHPLWFFPPFLPNPYLNPMNMGMSLPGLLPPHVPQPPPTSAPYLPGTIGLQTPDNLLSSFRSSADSLLHHHHAAHQQQRSFGSPPDLGLSGKKESEVGQGSGGSVKGGASGSKRGGGSGSSKGSKKSSSFSISRLTSPSPSSNSSGGSLTSKGSNHNNNNYNPHPPHHVGGGSGMSEQPNGKTASLALGGAETMMMMSTTTSAPGRMSSKAGAGGNKASSESGSESGAVPGNVGTGSTTSTNCVDLRVGGRSWEKSGVSAPPPRSIYKPLSAFHDPAELNLAHSSTLTAPQRSSPDTLSSPGVGFNQEHDGSGSLTSTKPLSTTYVLKNLHHIYLSVKEKAGESGTDSLSSHLTPTINNNTEHHGHHQASSAHFKTQQQQFQASLNSVPPSGGSSRKASHPAHLRPFNYFIPGTPDMNNHDHSISDETKKKVIDLSGVSEVNPGREKVTSLSEKKAKDGGSGGDNIRIPLPRPIKGESNYTRNKRLHSSSLNSLTSSSNLSFDEEEEEEPVELRKNFKYSRSSEPKLKGHAAASASPASSSQYNDDDGDTAVEHGQGSDIVNVLSETEPEDDHTKSESSDAEDTENLDSLKNYRTGTSPEKLVE